MSKLRVDGITFEMTGENVPAAQEVIDRTEKKNAELQVSLTEALAEVTKLDAKLKKKQMKGDVVACDACDGKGSFGDPDGDGNEKCDYCDGKGKVLAPKKDEDEEEAESATEKEAKAAHKDGFMNVGLAIKSACARAATAATKRADLVNEAKGFLGADFDATKLDNAGVRAAVIAKLKPNFKLDGKNGKTVAVAYEMVVGDVKAEEAAKPTPADLARAGAIAPVVALKSDEAPSDPHAARQRWLNHIGNAWKNSK